MKLAGLPPSPEKKRASLDFNTALPSHLSIAGFFFHHGAVPLMPGTMLSTAILIGVHFKATGATRQKEKTTYKHVSMSRSFWYE